MNLKKMAIGETKVLGRKDFIVYHDKGMKMPQMRNEKTPKPWKSHPYWVKYVNDSPVDMNLPASEKKVWDYSKNKNVPVK